MKIKFAYLLFGCTISTLSIFDYTNTTQAQDNPHMMDINQTLSDGAQKSTIAFNGLAFLSGDFCSCTFLPPGKVSDYFGFQYLRDNDPTQMGHNTDFLTLIANNMLHVLTLSQKNQLVTLAKKQVDLINQYAYMRLPLIKAFERLLKKDLPQGCTGLDRNAVKKYSAQLYRLDGKISIARAEQFGSIIKALDNKQKIYLDSLSKIGVKYWPVLPEQIDKRTLNNNEFVAVMTYASEMYAWYKGNEESDVYFCPERQGDYFGSFYLKDAPAVRNPGYSINTERTKNGGEDFIIQLNPSQALLITSLVDSQRTALNYIVDQRKEISKLLRGYLWKDNIDTSTVLELSEKYGELDGEISYYYATNFSKVAWTMTPTQITSLKKIRNLDKYPCLGAYLYSENINLPEIINTDIFFMKPKGK